MKTTFRKPVILLLALCIALSACLCACNNNIPKNFPVAVSVSDRSALELCTTLYKDSELEEIYAFMCEGNDVKKLNDSYPIECLRQDEEEYRVLYGGNKRLLVLRFDAEGSWIKDDKLTCIYRVVDTRGKFDKLSVGDPVTKVQSSDPTCYFPFLVDKTSDRLVTYHYTEDGYCTKIQYDADFNISDISYTLM